MISFGFLLVRLLLLILDEKVQIACFAASVCLVFKRGRLCDFSLGVIVPRHLKYLLGLSLDTHLLDNDHFF